MVPSPPGGQGEVGREGWRAAGFARGARSDAGAPEDEDLFIGDGGARHPGLAALRSHRDYPA